MILAATSAKLAGIEGADELLDSALNIYDRFFWDHNKGLAVDTYNTEFTECDKYRGLNANMHTVEVFLAVADSCNSLEYRKKGIWPGKSDIYHAFQSMLIPYNSPDTSIAASIYTLNQK